eukprot:2558174-Rhodomonas_salina.2
MRGTVWVVGHTCAELTWGGAGVGDAGGLPGAGLPGGERSALARVGLKSDPALNGKGWRHVGEQRGERVHGDDKAAVEAGDVQGRRLGLRAALRYQQGRHQGT